MDWERNLKKLREREKNHREVRNVRERHQQKETKSKQLDMKRRCRFSTFQNIAKEPKESKYIEEDTVVRNDCVGLEKGIMEVRKEIGDIVFEKIRLEIELTRLLNQRLGKCAYWKFGKISETVEQVETLGTCKVKINSRNERKNSVDEKCKRVCMDFGNDIEAVKIELEKIKKENELRAPVTIQLMKSFKRLLDRKRKEKRNMEKFMKKTKSRRDTWVTKEGNELKKEYLERQKLELEVLKEVLHELHVKLNKFYYEEIFIKQYKRSKFQKKNSSKEQITTYINLGQRVPQKIFFQEQDLLDEQKRHIRGFQYMRNIGILFKKGKKAEILRKNKKRLEFHITRTWDDQKVGHTPVKISLHPGNQDEVTIEVNAEFIKNFSLLKGKPSDAVNINESWDYHQAVKVFFVGKDEMYLEAELSTFGQHSIRLFSEREYVIKLCYVAQYRSSISGNVWCGILKIPAEYFPPSVFLFNAHAIYESGNSKIYEALYPVPSGHFKNPDIQRLEFCRCIEFDKILPSNKLSKLSSIWKRALKHAASVYMQQPSVPSHQISSQTAVISSLNQSSGVASSSKVQTNNLTQFKKGQMRLRRPKPLSKLQQFHCKVYGISCSGPQTYKEHLKGRKLKQKEAATKTENAPYSSRGGKTLRCELCDVTFTRSDAYAAHVSGAKHQKVVKSHNKLRRPVPSAESQGLSLSRSIPPKSLKTKRLSVKSGSTATRCGRASPSKITFSSSVYMQQPSVPSHQTSSQTAVISSLDQSFGVASSSKVQTNKLTQFKTGPMRFQRPKVLPKLQQLHCEVYELSCSEPQVVKSHNKLRKPVPSAESQGLSPSSSILPKSLETKRLSVKSGSTVTGCGKASPSKITFSWPDASKANDNEIQPVGQDYIEEIKHGGGKVVSFHCKLCECWFYDRNIKEIHVKGQRHRLQYEKKVNPNLVMDIKKSLRQRKIQKVKLGQQMSDDFLKRHKEEIRLEFFITRTWDDQKVSHTPVKISLHPVDKDEVTIEVNAEFVKNFSLLKGKPSDAVNINEPWDYHQAVKVFFVGKDEMYLEAELSSFGQHYISLFSKREDVIKLCYVAQYRSSISGNVWCGILKIPAEYFPPSVFLFNAHAIYESGNSKIYEALYPVPTGHFKNPDIQHLEFCRCIEFDKILPPNKLRKLSSVWKRALKHADCKIGKYPPEI